MTKRREDPAAALAKANADASVERKLTAFLDRILDQEEIREDARNKIDSIWKEIHKAGYEIAEARRSLVRRAISRPLI